jgi:hypothetical protein
MIRDLDIFDEFNETLAHISGDFFIRGYKDISRLLNDAVAALIFSADSEKQFDHLQDLMFLYLYLFILHHEMEDILQMTGSYPARDLIYNDYDLDSVRKYFACNFIEIIPLLEQFDVSIPAGDYDGIGYMYIQPGNAPEFSIS